MWLLGVAFLLLITCSISPLVAGRRVEAATEIWDVTGTDRTYTTIVGTLAGFSVTSAIFIANLAQLVKSAAFESVMALFLVAFLIFISAAMQFGTTPNLPNPPSQAYQTIQGLSHLLANGSYYMGLSVSWLGLPLLLSAVGLRYLSEIFLWLLLFAILAGSVRLCSASLSIFAGTSCRAALTVPALCFAGSCFFSLVLARQFRELLPQEHGPALFAVICFVIAAVGFALQSSIAASLQKEASSVAFAKVGGRLLVAYTGGLVTASSLLWLAVAAAL